VPKVSDEHRASRRNEILVAARTCVIDQGFHKTTMADVIRTSGLSAGAVYGYFKSKEELVAAIADDALSTVDQLFDRILATEEPLSPAIAIRAALEHIVYLGQQPGGDFTRVAIQAWAEALHNETIMATASSKYRLVRGKFVAVAERAQKDGTVDPDTDPECIAQVMFGLLPGFLLQRLILGDVTPDSYSAGLAALLRPPPPEPT
jgi:AcrR family transcriptional regulator